MVVITDGAKPMRLTAYLMTDLTPKELDNIHREFAVGIDTSYGQEVELFIKDVKDYRTMTHADIRRVETASGQTGPFLLIDRNAVDKNALWYIKRFAPQNDLDNDMAESDDVLWKILISTIQVPLSHINYHVGNMHIHEDLGSIGAGMTLTEDYEQTEPFNVGMDEAWYERHRGKKHEVAVFAEPGEVENNSEGSARLTEEVANATGLSRDWVPRVNTRGYTGPFSEDAVKLNLSYVDGRAPPPYKKPEGSL